MSRLRDVHAALREVVRQRRGVLVAGTGVSIAATNGAAEASWAGLLKHGIGWLREHGHISEGVAQAHLNLIADAGAGTHHYIAAAQDVAKGMGGHESDHFRKWLGDTVGSLVAVDRAVLDALDALRDHGNLLATTNYDSLLLGTGDTLRPVTWRQGDDFLEAVRNKRNDTVLFLHGYWRRPDSVVLDWTSYDQIVRDDRYRKDLEAFWHANTWVYVGCGVNGLSDPDLGLLLERYGGRLRDADAWDYCLVRQSQREAFQAHFDERDLNIVAVSYGARQEDLAGYLRSLLDAPPKKVAAHSGPDPAPPPAAPTQPRPPDLYAVPHYIGSHAFVGRDSQLRDLDDWSRGADPTNLLLYEAIGGSGKSILTWTWVTEHAPLVRPDWAGRFWYSFYERGAVMAHFCRHALAYMTGRPLKEFESIPMATLAPALVEQLQTTPWLVVLDGLERVLVAYHRIDAAELPDEALDKPTDAILDRSPTTTIREEDGDLLRQLAGARPSKVLVTSRLTPRVLLNAAGQPIPGVKRQPLGGLRPADAEAMFRAQGVHGDSDRIQRYLTENCDNHPLVIGALAGLVVNYLPARDDFGAWADDPGPSGGGRLDLADLDLVQRRNHILHAAVDDLPPRSRELLSMIALLPEDIDFKMLSAINPFIPREPEEVPAPARPEENLWWEDAREDVRAFELKNYERWAAQRQQYEAELAEWQGTDVIAAEQALAEAVRDLEQRGLLQYDQAARRHDLHPVVRAVASRGIQPADLERHGKRLVDHFTAASITPYEVVSRLEDVAPVLQVIRTLLRMGHLEEAAAAYVDPGLVESLVFNLEAYVEVTALLRPFFGRGWNEPATVDIGDRVVTLTNVAGLCLEGLGEREAALTASGHVIIYSLKNELWHTIPVELRNVASLVADKKLATTTRLQHLSFDFSKLLGRNEFVFKSLVVRFSTETRLGRWDDAAATWNRLDGMGRDWPRNIYRPGEAELEFALCRYYQELPIEIDLRRAEVLAEQGQSRQVLRIAHRFRGLWHLRRNDWAAAWKSFHEAASMARERKLIDVVAEAGIARAGLALGSRTPEEARQEALRLGGRPDAPHYLLAQIWRALDDTQSAASEALRDYHTAWGQGEPYVFRYRLRKAAELLDELGVPVPNLTPYDPAQDKPFPWEEDVVAAIERLNTEAAERDVRD